MSGVKKTRRGWVFFFGHPLWDVLSHDLQYTLDWIHIRLIYKPSPIVRRFLIRWERRITAEVLARKLIDS